LGVGKFKVAVLYATNKIAILDVGTVVAVAKRQKADYERNRNEYEN
jgi:hypothetical protein